MIAAGIGLIVVVQFWRDDSAIATYNIDRRQFFGLFAGERIENVRLRRCPVHPERHKWAGSGTRSSRLLEKRWHTVELAEREPKCAGDPKEASAHTHDCPIAERVDERKLCALNRNRRVIDRDAIGAHATAQIAGCLPVGSIDDVRAGRGRIVILIEWAIAARNGTAAVAVV